MPLKSGEWPTSSTHLAHFCHFDNDGDADLLIGRTLAPALLLENKAILQSDVDFDHDGPLPWLVSSVVPRM